MRVDRPVGPKEYKPEQEQKTPMAIRHNSTLLCEFVIQDANGRFSFINVVDNVRLPSIPGGLVSLNVAVNVTGEVGEEFSITIRDPKSKVLGRVAGQIKESDRVPASRYSQTSTTAILQIQPAVFHVEGVYHVVVKSGTKVLKRKAFGVFEQKTAVG
jgi:hypothetical protein